MSVPIVAFFNNKGGVGKTSLAYHLAWMFAEQGKRVVAADFDPQSNLSAAFLDEERLEGLWPEGSHPRTVFGSIEPLLRGVGDIAPAYVEPIDDNIGLVVGDLTLSSFEDELSAQWPGCLDGKERSFRVISAFWRILDEVSRAQDADIVLVDVGPNLGAINRAILVAADHVVIPLAPDLFSLQGLRNLGPTLRRWRDGWGERLAKSPAPDLALPSGAMEPLGYVVQQHGVRLDRPVVAYSRWMARIPAEYRAAVLAEGALADPGVTVQDDPHCLALLKHYHSLVPMAQEARKPLFLLKPADGAIGAHQRAVQRAYQDFAALAHQIMARLAAPA